ncbi:MAG: hypothetical protein P1V34_16375 [Alphaproteobacteria bacterium]|nr:hypothetical protein [Alphaproteobacteria bacterium]
MTDIRFISDRNAIVLVHNGKSVNNRESGSTDSSKIADDSTLTHAAPLRLSVERSRETSAQDMEQWGLVSLLSPEDLAKIGARCLNAALSIDSEDISTASQALEILVAQQLAKVDADDPVKLVEEAIRYVLRQERWQFDITLTPKEDGTRLSLSNPNGAPVPLAIHVSNRGKTPSFWVMQDNRLVQGGHAYKIPIQAATSLKQAIAEYITQHDVGTIRPFG